MSRPARVVVVTLGLVIAGAIFGALAGGLAFTAVRVLIGLQISREAFGIGAFFGAPLGAVTAPLLSWLLLRRVPLGQMFLTCWIATMIGGVVASFSPVSDIMLMPLLGGFAGCLVAAIGLWLQAKQA